jgi:hypothetical protein
VRSVALFLQQSGAKSGSQSVDRPDLAGYFRCISQFSDLVVSREFRWPFRASMVIESWPLRMGPGIVGYCRFHGVVWRFFVSFFNGIKGKKLFD